MTMVVGRWVNDPDSQTGKTLWFQLTFPLHFFCTVGNQQLRESNSERMSVEQTSSVHAYHEDSHHQNKSLTSTQTSAMCYMCHKVLAHNGALLTR